MKLNKMSDLDWKSKKSLIGSLKTALTVGIILSAVNQSELLLGVELTFGSMVRVGFNFLVPFCVATYSKYQYFKNNNLNE